MHRQIKQLTIMAVLTLMSFSSFAQPYPSRPITLLIPWAAGGGADAMGRMIGSLLEQELKQPIAVVNRTGGSGVVGHSSISTAPPDGYTLGLATMEISIFKVLGLADLTPQSYTMIARIAALDAAVLVRPDSPYKNATELLEAIRKAPDGTMKAAGSGQGGSWHLAMGGWLLSEGIKPSQVRYVPSSGASAALQELVSGGVDFATCSATEARSLIEAGKVRALALMAPGRSKLFANVPTLKEATNSNWLMSSWFALVGPKGLSPKIVETLTVALEKAHDRPEFRTFLKERGFTPIWETGAELMQFANDATTSSANVIEAMGLKR